MIWTWILLCFLPYLSVLVLVLWTMKLEKQAKLEIRETVGDDFTVLIPFRNEESRLEPLIDAINNSTWKPRILFVDDHSTDSSINLIQEKAEFTYEIVQNHGEGKKAAIKKGLGLVDTRFTLTLDADVSFSSNYFEEIKKLPIAPLSILPVEMTRHSLIGAFFRWEYQLQRNCWMAFGIWQKPMTGSGANLLMETSVYWTLDKTRSDDFLLSGDDHFLIQEAVKQNIPVRYNLNHSLKVLTPAAETVAEGMQQRWRWVSKASYQAKFLPSLYAFYLLFAQILIYSLLLYLLIKGYYWLALGVVVVKADLDGWINTFEFMKDERTPTVWLFELLFPFYMLGLFFGGFFAKVLWKNREIKKPHK